MFMRGFTHTHELKHTCTDAYTHQNTTCVKRGNKKVIMNRHFTPAIDQISVVFVYSFTRACSILYIFTTVLMLKPRLEIVLIIVY